MKNIIIQRFELALCAALTVGCGQQAAPSEHQLSSTELARIRGGLTADIVFPGQDNWYQTADNLQFRANIEHAYPVSPVEVTIAQSDDTKLGFQLVETPAPDHTGVFNMRVSAFPYPGKHDIKMRYLNPDAQEYWDAAGTPSSRADMYIHPNVHLYKLKFFNTKWTSGGMGTSFTEDFIKTRVDSETTTLNRSSDTVDGPYYGECSSTYKTQWRYDGLSSINLNHGIYEVGSCTDMESVLEGCVVYEGRGCLDPLCDHLMQCLNRIWNATDAANDPDSIHITFVDTLASSTCDYGGFKLSWNQNGEDRSVIILQEEFATNHFVTALAHELGHGFIGGHTNSTDPTCERQCDGDGSVCTSNDDCDEDESCLPAYGISDRNLMCSFGGRALSSTQCDLTYQTYAPYVDQL